MADVEILVGSLMEESWFTIEQVAGACGVEVDWLLAHLEADLFPSVASTAGVWRFPAAALRRARRMRQLERDFDAVPELAALVVDMQEELGRLRTRLACVEPR